METGRAFLVESNPLLVLDLMRLLRHLDIGERIRFSNFQQAWLPIQVCPPDVLIFDIPFEQKLTSLGWISRMRSRFSFPLLLISTWEKKDLCPSLQHMEFTEVLEKPFPDWEFLEIMDRFGFQC